MKFDSALPESSSTSASRSIPRTRLAARLIAWRWWLVGIAAIVLAITWGPASRLSLDRRIEQMFPPDDPAVASYHLLTERFGGNAIVMLVYRDADVFTPEGVRRAEAIGERVEQIRGVRGVLSVAQVNEALAQITPSGLFGGGPSTPLLDDSSLSSAFRQLFAGYTHNQQHSHAAIVAMLSANGSPTSNGSVPAAAAETAWDEATISELQQVADSLPAPLDRGVLVGQPVLVTTGFNMIAEDGRRLATTTLALLSLLVFLLFLSLRWVAVSLLVIGWSTIVTRGSFFLMGYELTLVSSMLTAIITVIAFAAILHIAVGFRQRRRRGDSPRMAAERTLARLMPPVFWACLTDAAGFAALLVSDVGPVRDFGMMMAGGALAVLLAILLLVPAVLLLPPHRHLALPVARVLRGRSWRDTTPNRMPARRSLDRLVQRRVVRATAWMIGRRRWLYGLALAIAIATATGLVLLRVETNFLKNFRSDSDIARSYALVEDDFGGAGVWDVLLPVPPGELTSEYLTSVRSMEEKLRDIEVSGSGSARITKTLSMADAEAAAAQSSNPIIRLASPTVRLTGMRLTMPVFVDALITSPAEDRDRWLRVMLRSPESLTAEEKSELIAAVEATVVEHTQTETWKAFFVRDETNESAPAVSADHSGKITGYYVLLARLVSNLLADQWLCLGLAAACVFAVLWVAFGSLRIALIAMIPNTLPVLAVLAALGWLSVPMNMGGAMIAAVSIGLTIDSSIHFLSSYVRTRKERGRDAFSAVIKAQSRVGLAVLLTTAALVIGFSVLSTSPFIPTATFGTLLSAALLLGTAANLTLLPVMLVQRPQR